MPQVRTLFNPSTNLNQQQDTTVHKDPPPKLHKVCKKSDNTLQFKPWHFVCGFVVGVLICVLLMGRDMRLPSCRHFCIDVLPLAFRPNASSMGASNVPMPLYKVAPKTCLTVADNASHGTRAGFQEDGNVTVTCLVHLIKDYMIDAGKQTTGFKTTWGQYCTRILYYRHNLRHNINKAKLIDHTFNSITTSNVNLGDCALRSVLAQVPRTDWLLIATAYSDSDVVEYHFKTIRNTSSSVPAIYGTFENINEVVEIKEYSWWTPPILDANLLLSNSALERLVGDDYTVQQTACETLNNQTLIGWIVGCSENINVKLVNISGKFIHRALHPYRQYFIITR